MSVTSDWNVVKVVICEFQRIWDGTKLQHETYLLFSVTAFLFNCGQVYYVNSLLMKLIERRYDDRVLLLKYPGYLNW